MEAPTIQAIRALMPDTDEPGDGRLHGVAADQPPHQDQRGHPQRGADGGHQAEDGGHRDQDGDGQRRVDQAADAAHLGEQRLGRSLLGFLVHGSRGVGVGRITDRVGQR